MQQFQNVELKKKRVMANFSAHTGKLVARNMSLEWIVKQNGQKYVIALDSMAALLSIKSSNYQRKDIIYEIYYILYKLDLEKMLVQFIWVPGPVGVEGNKWVDILAKQALKC